MKDCRQQTCIAATVCPPAAASSCARGAAVCVNMLLIMMDVSVVASIIFICGLLVLPADPPPKAT